MLKLKRVYEGKQAGDGIRLLVVRLWPRGLSRDAAGIDEWTCVSEGDEGEMARLFERLTTKKEKDIRILADFVAIFCRENHTDGEKSAFFIRDGSLQNSLKGRTAMLCQDCQKLLTHGIAKLLQCPYDPKPMCKKCQTHCYAPGYRERMREVMKFSGLYLVKHGRFDMMLHYFF